MHPVEESLRALLVHSVPRPGPEPDPATAAAFDQLLSEAMTAGPAAPLDYRLSAPKWQFLCHAADHGGYVLHGTVYLLPAGGFAEQPPLRLGDYWVRTQQVARATPVRPAAKLSVEPADFPLLASIRGHDTHMRVIR